MNLVRPFCMFLLIVFSQIIFLNTRFLGVECLYILKKNKFYFTEEGKEPHQEFLSLELYRCDYCGSGCITVPKECWVNKTGFIALFLTGY